MKTGLLWIVVLAVVLAGVDTAPAVGVGATLKAGTLGVGGDLTIGIVPKLNARLEVNWFGYSYDDFDLSEGNGEDGEEEVSAEELGKVVAELSFLTAGLLLDWHPWGNSFRLTAGAFYNGNELSLSAEGDTIEIGEDEYEISDLGGSISFNTLSPYAGIGFGNAVGRNGRWHFAFDLGVLYHGTPEISLSATAEDIARQAELDEDIREEKEDIEDQIAQFVIWPVLSLGVSFTF